MSLQCCKKNKLCEVISVNILDDKLKLRLYEIGFFPSSKIKILNMSHLKKTMLVQVLDSCFIIKSEMAEQIEVKYV